MSIALRAVQGWLNRLSDPSRNSLSKHDTDELELVAADLYRNGLPVKVPPAVVDAVPAGWEELVSVNLGEIRALRRKSDGATVTGRVDVDGKGRVDVQGETSVSWDALLWVMRRPWNDRG